MRLNWKTGLTLMSFQTIPSIKQWCCIAIPAYQRRHSQERDNTFLACGGYSLKETLLYRNSQFTKSVVQQQASRGYTILMYCISCVSKYCTKALHCKCSNLRRQGMSIDVHFCVQLSLIVVIFRSFY